MTSLMFLILLGIVTCDTLCYKPTGVTDNCPKGIPDTSIVTGAEADLLGKIKTEGTILYIAAPLTDALADAKIKLISEIHSYKSAAGNIAVEFEISTAFTITSLNVTKIDLEIKNAASVSPAVTLTCTSLILNEESTVATASTVEITKLSCSSLKAGEKAIGLTKTEITVTGKDVISKIEPDTTNVKLSDNEGTATAVSIPATVTTVNINSVVTIAAAKLTVTGATLNSITQAVTVNLTYGNEGKSIIELISEAGTTVSNKLSILVNTYYKEGDQIDLIRSRLTLNDKFKLDTSGNRETVPASSQYCLDQAFARNEKCPTSAQVLWSEAEVAKMSNPDGLIELYLSGYNAAANILKLNMETYKAKSIKFLSVKPDTEKQNVQFSIKATEAVTGDFGFDGVSITLSLPTGTTANGAISFKKLFVRKTTATTIVEPPASGGGSSSKNLKAVTTITAEDLTSDIVSFSALEIPKPTKFTAIDVTGADFSGDGKSVTIGGKTLTEEKIPVPFTIATLPGQDVTTPVDIKIGKNGEKPGTALGFQFDVAAGSELNVKYDGDWSANKIIVNVASKDSKFLATQATDAKPPNMEAYGEGTAKLGEKDIPKPAPPAGATPTPKGGLSGGAIAGIVIACVVVVAAVVVVVVVVIKKKKGKVAN